MNARSAVLGATVLVVTLTAGAAQSLTGSNTVYSDDIVDGQVAYADIRDNAMTGRKILDSSITSADLATNSVGASEIAPGSVGRSDLDFAPLSNLVRVNATRTYAANEFAGHIVPCPNASPIPVSAGYTFGSTEAGFALRSSVPLEHAWVVYGQNTLPQPRDLTVYVICVSDGSSSQ